MFHPFNWNKAAISFAFAAAMAEAMLLKGEGALNVRLARAGIGKAAPTYAPSDAVAAYPGAIRTFYKLGRKRYSGCNLFLARSPNVARIADFWRRMESHRKQPLRLIWEVGPIALVRVLLGLMDAAAAFAYLSRKAGGVIRPVELSIAEAAIDVDKPADLELVERIFASRR